MGTEAQFSWLEDLLSDGMCHVFEDCILPDCCTPTHSRLGFEKSGSIFIAYIDCGIQTTSQDRAFRSFLEKGEARFICMEDLIEFFHSLNSLFSDSPAAVTPVSEPVDIDALVAQRSGRDSRALLNPDAVSTPLKEIIFGQDQALDTLAELICLNRLRKKEKLLVVMLLGPTATGKSETARALSQVLTSVTGNAYGYIEVAGSEFAGEQSVHRFFGAPPGYVGHGNPTLLDAVRKQPRHVIVINEIEKGHPKLIEGLMEALDTGILGMADNSGSIDLNQSILLLTSNLPIPLDQYNAASDFQRMEMCRDRFSKHCGRPEISGKIGNYIVYQPLSTEAFARIVVKFIRSELDNFGLRLGTVSNSIMNEFLDCETSYGARAISLNVSATIGRQLQRLLLKNGCRLPEGQTVHIGGTLKNIEFTIE